MKKSIAIGIALMMLVSIISVQGAWAAEKSEGYTEIATYEDLVNIANNVEGCYILTDNIDMKDREWKPIEFRGVLEGNGYSILNLHIDDIGEGSELTYDGNMKIYDTCFSGLFSIIRGATINNIKLVNFEIVITTDKDCFVGCIAGYSENSHITNSSIEGRICLTVSSKMFGVGGIIGYGYGSIDDTSAKVELINIDTNRTIKNEQFLGGAFAAGYVDLGSCNIDIAAYVSDHGYVHTGGLVGMYMLYPRGTKYEGYIKKCNVNGFITFYEDNNKRRAYCAPYVGEIMNWTFLNTGNKNTFKRDERFEYDIDLKPDMCEKPVYTKEVVPPTCDTFGYTQYTCDECGYSYTDDYTLYQHRVGEWTVTKQPTFEEQGIETAYCTECNEKFEKTVDKLIDVASCTLSEAEVSLEVGAKVQIIPELLPANAHINNILWNSKDTNIATVDEEGNILAIGKGTTIITYSVNDGRTTADCKVNVTKKETTKWGWWLCIGGAVLIVLVLGVVVASVRTGKKQEKDIG